MAELVKKSAFARMQGWSPSYVTNLAQKGRIVFGPCGKLVDVAATRALIGETADPSKQGVVERWSKERDASANDVPPLPANLEGYDYQLARAKRETHLARIAEMEEQERLGKLLDTGRVVRALTDNATAMRSALERLPDRLAPVLAAESDPTRIYDLLDVEIARLLDDLERVALELPRAMTETKQ